MMKEKNKLSYWFVTSKYILVLFQFEIKMKVKFLIESPFDVIRNITVKLNIIINDDSISLIIIWNVFSIQYNCINGY